MKKLALILSIGYLFIASCSNDFDLTDDWKDIAVVYGLLNPSDTAHYVKVSKAFLDQETSSLVVAKIPDSLYYKDVTVDLKQIGSTGDVEATFPMTLVDANLEGFPKPEGVFADSPNYVFKSLDNLNSEKIYRLEIINGENSKTVTAETPIIGSFRVTRPTSSVTNPSSRLRWLPGIKTLFSWQNAENAAFYDLTIEVIYEEAANNGATIVKKLVWEIEENILHDQPNTSNVNLEYDGDVLYQFLRNSLEPGSQYCRKLLHFNVLVDAGGDELFNYINAGKANSGLTSTLPLPDYSNVSNDGRGIFSTRRSIIETLINVDGTVFDELMQNPLTSDLGFISEISTCN